MRTRRATYLALILAALFAGYIATTETASAVGSAADAMCLPYANPGCSCGQSLGPKGCQPDPSNKFMCPCSDSTSGFSTNGVCISTFKCQAQSTGGGGLTSMSQLMQTLGQLLQSLGQSSGGGGGGGSGGGSTGCTTYTQTSNPNNTDPCQYYVPGSTNSTSQLLNGTGGTDSTVNDLISSLIGSGNSNTNNNSNSSTNTSTTTGNTSGSVVPNDILATISNVTNPQNLTPGTSAKISQNAFGNAPGVTGDIQVLSGNRVTMLASNRDIAGNKQTSGFYGFNTSASEDVPTVYIQACAARQWASNFISTIIPMSYLDNLCASHGYAVGPPQLQPATPPPAPTPAPAATSTPQYLGPMKADIWISPASISSGSRTSLFWNASGVLTCQVSSPSGVLGSALSGTAAVGPLTQSTTYSIACQSATSSVSNQATVTVQ